jgi:abortive infection bacteriophage resistance protein
MRVVFCKPALTLDEQIQKLAARGLVIDNQELVRERLGSIGYYRLSAYALPFQLHVEGKPFVSGTHFEDILRVYEFDRKLRLLVMDALERIEVSVRANLVNATSLAHGPHWYMNPSFFRSGHARNYDFDHEKFLRQIEKSIKVHVDPYGKHILNGGMPEVFIKHYYKTYDSPELPPFWMVAETLSIGSLSTIFSALAEDGIRSGIASSFSVHERSLSAWMEAFTYLRNLCAHHCRLWNRVFSIMPMIVKGRMQSLLAQPYYDTDPDASSRNNRFFRFSVVLFYMLSVAEPGTHWNERVRKLIDDNPFIDTRAMGFPDDWRGCPMWKCS